MLALLSIPSFLLSNWKLVLAGLAAGALAIFVVSWEHRGEQVAIMHAQNIILQSDVDVLNEQVKIMQEAQKVASDRAVVVEHDATEFNQIIEDAARAPQKDDAPIAPVLRHGLDSLGKLLHTDARIH